MTSNLINENVIWPGITEAISYLLAHGYKVTKGFCWVTPSEEHKITETEKDAVDYLIKEGNWGEVIQMGSKLHKNITGM